MPVLIALALAAALLAPLARADVTAQPVLGLADRQTVIMGAASDGAPGETWAYRQLPLDVPLLSLDSPLLALGPVAHPSTPSPQLVFERTTDADGGVWSLAQTPVDELGNAYRGPRPNAATARITAHGGGALVGRDSDRPAGAQVVVLVRDPDSSARFAALPAPPPGVVDAGAGEALAADQGAGHVPIAAWDDGTHTHVLLPVVGGAVEDAVAHWDGSGWSREPIDVPPASSASFHVAALAASAGGDAYLLAETDPRLGDGLVLFAREDGAGGARWVQRDLGAPLLAAASTPAQGVESLAPLDDDGQQPLTATADGVWIDGTMTLDGGGASDLTAFWSKAGGQVAGTWCDAQAPDGTPLCDHPLGFRFGRRAGYRSFAWAGPEGGGVGRRVVTNPLDPGGDDATNMGTWASFDGDAFTREPGAAGGFHSSGGFATPDRGWLEGPVQVTAADPPAHLASWPVALRSPLLSIATAPGATPGDLSAQALAVGAGGGVLRYVPGSGWKREFLLTSTGAVSSALLRGVAWPEPGRAYAVGDLGAMWLWRAETGLWEKDESAPIAFDGNLMGVAFDASDPQRGYAVGRDGVLLAYGKTWTQEPLPAGFAHADLTSVAFAGHEALVAAGSDVLVNDGGAAGWHADAGMHALLAQAPSAPRIVTVAALPDGGAIAAGDGVVLERDGAGAPWRPAAAPLPGASVIAAAPVRDGAGHVRAVVALAPAVAWPLPTPLPPEDPDLPPAILPPFALAGDGYLLRETDGGWVDEQRADFAGVANDKPVKADPVAALALDPGSGAGWAVGGWSGQPDDAGRGTGASGPGAAVRARVQTAAVQRYDPRGTPDAPPGEAASPVPLDPGLVTFAVAGHASCDGPCALLANLGIGPDRALTALGGALQQYAGRAGAPRALLYTGGRLPVDSPVATPLADEQRLATLLGHQPLPAFAAVSAADSKDGGATAFRTAFDAQPAPFGEGPSPNGIAPVAGGAAPAPGGARTHYAFDSSGPAGTVRVIVIDNSAGSLAASDPYQVPAEPQEPWLRATLQDARARGIPAIVVGSRDLNTRFVPRSNVASDGDEIARLLVDEGASAYLYERPEEQRLTQVPAGASATIPEFGTGTLGYRSPIANATAPGQADALFGDAGYLLVSLDVAHRDLQTNRAPAAARLIPLMESLSLDALDGTLLRRSAPALFDGLGRRPRGGDRWGPLSASDGSPNPAGSDPYTSFPPALCKQANCGTRIAPEYTFTSSDDDIADFVAVDPNTTNLRKPLHDANGKVVTDARSGLLCAFNPGTTTLTISAGGISYSQQVTVQAGSVQQPCGTRPLKPSRFRAQPSGTPATAPPPALAPAVAPSPAPPPPPPPPPPAPHAAPKPLPLPSLAAVPAAVPPVAPPPRVTPPPPVSSFARPIPPGGAVVRVYEEKREEEVAPEQQSAFAAYRADDHQPLGPALLGLALIAALAGATLTLGVRTRDRHRNRPRRAALARASASITHRRPGGPR
ncbi:MAG: hypothetical protein JSS99_05680 [Actinobacteria bacterium]|nr:hypothetical protein [Actinomycetota bacterium]